ncbi:DUF6571 family protein [Streptomyces sp. NPDC056308]|uniref:DUF6571 family protein n=1 Tax=unclassified Streptomyces TaxID=2593676 RepID=UPI0035E16AB2
MRAEEKQQAECGREATKLYSRWEYLDDKERERLLTLAEGGKDSPAFAAELMQNLDYNGRKDQEALLLLAGSLEGGGRDGQVSATDARLYKALSGSLATATGPDKKGSSPWKKDKGEAFLTEVGDSIREWGTNDKHAYDGIMKNWQGTQEDPMKGLLNAMSRNSSAATHYFDPNTADNLKYFMEDRDWSGGDVESKMPAESQYISARAEFGAALEAAATGRIPGSPLHSVPAHHDGAETAIFERVMGEYTEALKKDQSAVPVSMRLPMADMIADYGSDVHQILGKNMDGPTDFNNLEIDRGDLTRIIRSTAEDPNAFKAIHTSQTVVIADGLDRFPADSFRKEDRELHAWFRQSSTVLGHLDGVRGDVIYDPGQAKKDANAWQKMVNYHLYGGALTPIPILGDAVQRAVDAGTNAYMNDENVKVDAATRNNMISHYDEGQKEMYAMLRKMARARGLEKTELDASPGEYEDGLQPIAEQWYQNGIKDADMKMGERY